MYYSSPQNQGNADLKQEESTSYEVGFRYTRAELHAEWNIFRRENKNLIDWAFQPQDSIWQAENITKLSTLGIEALVTINTPDFLSSLPDITNLTGLDLGCGEGTNSSLIAKLCDKNDFTRRFEGSFCR